MNDFVIEEKTRQNLGRSTTTIDFVIRITEEHIESHMEASRPRIE